MKIGDLVIFRGTWSGSAFGDKGPKTGVITQIWTSRSKSVKRADILWDNGELRQVSTHIIGVINESG